MPRPPQTLPLPPPPPLPPLPFFWGAAPPPPAKMPAQQCPFPPMARPRPPVVDPAPERPPVPPPSDAIVLFDGKDLLQWQSQDGTPAKWPVRDGFAEVAAGTGPIITRRVFGDVQLHIE